MTIPEIIKKLEKDGHELGIILNPPASVISIEKLENILNRKLPSDLRSFYTLTNGFETDDAIFNIVTIEEMINQFIESKESKLVFGEYMINSDTWDILLDPDDIERYRIVNSDHFSDEMLTLTNSLVDFLEKYLVGGGVFGDEGLYAWYAKIKNKNNT